jgi:hypothetical protein
MPHLLATLGGALEVQYPNTLARRDNVGNYHFFRYYCTLSDSRQQSKVSRMDVLPCFKERGIVFPEGNVEQGPGYLHVTVLCRTTSARGWLCKRWKEPLLPRRRSLRSGHCQVLLPRAGSILRSFGSVKRQNLDVWGRDAHIEE